MFEKLEGLLKEHRWRSSEGIGDSKGWRQGTYSMSVGLTRHIFVKGRPVGPTRFMKKDRRIYDECKRVFFDFEFDCVQINKNVLCPPHRDTNNIGESLLIGFGNYSGGETLIDGIKYDIYHTPVIFNGYEKEHSVCEFEGERYSVVLYNLCKKKKQLQ